MLRLSASPASGRGGGSQDHACGSTDV